MLEITRNNEKTQYHWYLRKIREITEKLKGKVSHTDLKVISDITSKCKENRFVNEKKRLKEKFDGLLSRRRVAEANS